MNFKDDFLLIKKISNKFESELETKLNLIESPAPLILESNFLNDYLNDSNSELSFVINNKKLEIAQSLAKWKRYALNKFDFKVNEGIYTNMIAIRQNEELDSTHSYHVDQWDWELIITDENRNIEFLKEIVLKLYKSILETQSILNKDIYKKNQLPNELFFITALELKRMYPELNAKQREDKITKEKRSVFIIGIGDLDSEGYIHESRSAEYDDWTLNGDLLFWNDVLGSSFEISSMGIRVNPDKLKDQLNKKNMKPDSKYHDLLLENKLPLTIGGGIGKSRLIMYLLNKEHISEVQVSVWDKKNINKRTL